MRHVSNTRSPLGLASGMIQDRLRDEMTLRLRGVESVIEVVERFLDGAREAHGLLDLGRARARIPRAAFERVIEGLEHVVVFADPDANGGAVVRHTDGATCKDKNPHGGRR